MNAMPVVTFSDVSMRFGEMTVLNELSFDIREKYVAGILGQSGSGKTTLLKLASGLASPTGGTVVENAGRIGYVFQEPRLLPWKTACENVSIPLLAAGLNSDDAKEKAMEWLSRMELDGFGDYYPKQLSGGMAQRVSLARAFAVEPDLLILDEPFSALDLQLRDSMFSLLKRQLESQPVTALYVSHVPEDVLRIATRIFVLTSDRCIKEISDTDRDNLEGILKRA